MWCISRLNSVLRNRNPLVLFSSLSVRENAAGSFYQPHEICLRKKLNIIQGLHNSDLAKKPGGRKS